MGGFGFGLSGFRVLGFGFLGLFGFIYKVS